MKLTLSLLFLVFTLYVYSQKPLKGTILIIVKNELSKEDNFFNVSKTLLGNGFLIDNEDSAHYYIESNKRRLPNSNISYKFNFLVKDSAIAVFGKLMDAYMPNTLSKSVFVYIQNKGLGKPSFNIMLNVAKQLGGNLYYFTDIEKFKNINDAEKNNVDDDIYYKSPKKQVPEIKTDIEV